MARVLVIDTETGGLDPLRFSILAIGAVVWDDGVVVATSDRYVREDEIVVEPVAMSINRIDIATLSNHGVSPAQAVADLRCFVMAHFPEHYPELGEPGATDSRRLRLAGHNVEFDVGFLKRLYRLAGADFHADFSHRVIDTTSVIAALVLAGKAPARLGSTDEVFGHFGVGIAAHLRHNALEDAKATAELLTRLVAAVRAS